jgi:hypothetical protein
MYFSYNQTSSCNGNPKATAPLITEASLVIQAATGSDITQFYTGASGAAAAYGGYVHKTLSCDAVKLVVTYLTGDDCNDCTSDTLNTTPVTITIPAGASGVQLPPGYITVITAQVVSAAGAPLNSVAGGTVTYTSSRAGNCGAGVVNP